MSGTKIESVQRVKDLGVTIAYSLKFSQQCKEAAGKANRMLGFINRNFSFKNKYVILPLYISLVRPHLEYADAILIAPPRKGYCKTRSCPGKVYKDDYHLASQITRGKVGTT